MKKGILPFLRAYVCELNNSCSKIPRKSYYNISIINDAQIGSDLLNLASQQNVAQLVNDSLKLVDLVSSQRDTASNATSKQLILFKSQINLTFCC